MEGLGLPVELVPRYAFSRICLNWILNAYSATLCVNIRSQSSERRSLVSVSNYRRQ